MNLNSKQCQNSIIVGDVNLDILDVSRNSRLIDECKLILTFLDSSYQIVKQQEKPHLVLPVLIISSVNMI